MLHKDMVPLKKQNQQRISFWRRSHNMSDSLTRAEEDKMVVKGSRATCILRLRATRQMYDCLFIWSRYHFDNDMR